MNKTLTIGFAFLSGCIFYSIQSAVKAQASNGENNYSTIQTNCVTKITKEEMETLLKPLSPQTLELLADDPETKKEYIDSVRELLAVACQAVKEGIADNDFIKQELKNLETEMTAARYDREINKGKDPTTPFSLITENQIKEFYVKADNQADYDRFLKVKIQSAKDNGQLDEEISEDNIKQAKDYFAKMQIYFQEAQSKSDTLPKEFWNGLNVSIKLQKAQLLSRTYTQKILGEKTKVTDAEIQAYIAKRPEFDTKAQKAKAEKILKRVKAGENFAALAKQFDEDPGSKVAAGLYKGVTEGQFVEEFEKPALSLKAGQIYPQVVETKFGYHIIKLEKRSETKDQSGELKLTYDVRHILISTTVKTTDDPASLPIPVKDFVKNKLEEEKKRKVLGEILMNNPVSIAEDFEIPKISDTQIQ